MSETTIRSSRKDTNFEIIFERNKTQNFYPKEKTLVDLFIEQVKKTPNNIAVTFDNQSMTYAVLDQYTNKFANFLINHGVGVETIVAVCLERSIDLIVSLLAILKANAAYMPIDTSYPNERACFMLQDAASPIVITQNNYESKFINANSKIININNDKNLIEDHSATHPKKISGPDNLAYVIYTSGSTGTPKGVCNIQRGLVNRIWWMQDKYKLSTEDKILQKTPYNFDVSVWEFFWPIITGAKLVISPPESHKDPNLLAHLIQDNEITVLHFVPSMLGIFLDEPEARSCKSIKYIFVSGEALSYSLQEKFFLTFDHAELHNLYGPTEAAIDVNNWQCIKNHPLGFVPIGKPISNIQLYILDEYMHPVEDGSVGELYIGGDGLARGYLNRPSLTKERFIKNPLIGTPSLSLYKTGDHATYLPDGNIKYIGRIDHQVKIHGIRIELQEIENSINLFPAVKRAIVIAKDDSQNTKRLVAYILPEEFKNFKQEDLISFLKHKLPSYMIPNVYIIIDNIPTTTNGKIDLKSLPTSEFSKNKQSNIIIPRNEIESNIKKIWEEILGVKNICVTSSFNEVGGDSIRAIQILQKIRSQGYYLTLSDFVEYPTIEGLAKLVKANNKKGVLKTSVDISKLIVPEDIKNDFDPNFYDIYPVSSMQEFMLRNYRASNSDLGIYHYQQCLTIVDTAEFEHDIFIMALEHIFLSSPNFRIFFINGFNKNIYQVVRKNIEMSVNYKNIEDQEITSQNNMIDQMMKTDREIPFDPWDRNSVLVRFHIFQRNKNTFDFFMSIHHAIYDGWSNIEFLRELFKNYSQLKRNININAQEKKNIHKEFIVLENEISESFAAETFWKNSIEKYDVDFSDIVDTPEHSNLISPRLDHYLTISFPMLDKKLRQKLSVGYKSIFLSSFLDTLSKQISKSFLTVGVVVNGRSENLSDPIGGINLFWNLMPFSESISEDKDAQIKRYEEKLLNMEPFNIYPLKKIEEMKGKPLFTSTFNFINFHNTSDLNQTELHIQETKFWDRFHYPLNFVVTLFPEKEKNNLYLRLEFDKNILSIDTMKRFLEDYVNILQKQYLFNS